MESLENTKKYSILLQVQVYIVNVFKYQMMSRIELTQVSISMLTRVCYKEVDFTRGYSFSFRTSTNLSAASNDTKIRQRISHLPTTPEPFDRPTNISESKLVLFGPVFAVPRPPGGSSAIVAQKCVRLDMFEAAADLFERPPKNSLYF